MEERTSDIPILGEAAAKKRGRKPSGIIKKRKTIRMHRILWELVCKEAEDAGVRPSTALNGIVEQQAECFAEKKAELPSYSWQFYVGHDHEKTATAPISLYLTEKTEQTLSALAKDNKESLAHIVTALLLDHYEGLLEVKNEKRHKEKKKSNISPKRRRNGRIHKDLWRLVAKEARIKAARPGTIVNQIIEEEAEIFVTDNIPFPEEAKAYFPNHGHTKTASKDISFYLSEDTQFSIIILGMRFMIPERELFTALIVHHFKDDLGLEEHKEEYTPAFHKVNEYRYEYNED